MSKLRSVGGWGEVDLDQRAITTEDDIVDLSELDRSDGPQDQPAPATHNGAAGHDERNGGHPSAPASPAHGTPTEAPPASDPRGHESDEDFDRWVEDHAPPPGSALAASKPSAPPLASDDRGLASEDAPRIASGTAGVPCADPRVPALTSSRSRLRRSGALPRLLGRLARRASAIGALTLTAGATIIAINATTTGTPHARPPVATSNAAAPIAGPSNWAGATLSTTIATVTSELRAFARAVPPAHHASHLLHKPRHHGPSHQAGISNHRHRSAVGEQSATSARASSPPQTYSYAPAPVTSASAPVTSSSASQTTASSQTQATRTSQPAFGQNGSLGPGRGAPGTQ